MIQRKYMKKRTICAMIAAIMAMGTVLTPVFAEETDTEPGSVQEETMQSEAASIQETEEQAVPESEQAENLEEEDAKEDEQENHAEPEITEDIGAQLEQDSDLTETVSESEAAKSEEQAEAEIEALYAQKTQEIHLDIADFDKSTGVVYLAKGGISYSAKSSGDGKISYSSSNPSIFTVDKNGKVMPKSGGTADLTIKAAATRNYKEAVKTIRITVNPKPYPTYIHTDPIVVYLGHAPVKLTAETLEYGKKGIEYISVDPEIAKVNKDGTVSFLRPGITAINAYVPETETTLESFKAQEISEQGFKTQFRDVSAQSQFMIGGAMSSGGQAASQMAQGIAGVVSAMQQKDAKDADIKAEREAMVMEIMRKAQEQNQSTAKALMDFINNLLSMIQQLNQNARQTEIQIAA